MKRGRIPALTLAAVALIAAPAPAQDAAGGGPPPAATEERAGEKEGLVARARRWMDEHQILERLSGEIDGWYPRLGGMTRGSGVALGPGYRAHVLGGRVRADVSAGLSTRGYKAVDASARWLQALDGRVELWTDFRYEDFPQEDFFGVGLRSAPDTRTSYDFDGSDVTVRALAAPVPWLRIGAAAGYTRPEVGPGSDADYPSIEVIFTDTEAPGLSAQPDFLYSTFFADVDTRDQRGHPSRGGRYRLSVGLFDDRTLHAYDHSRLDGEALQVVSLAGGSRHTLAGRVGFSHVTNGAGARVPFYFLAYVGGFDTVRSFRDFRFKDENALWLNLEYRRMLATWVSVAAFADAGEVRADWREIGLRGLRTGYGIGLRVHTSQQVLAQIDVGTGGGEGWQIFFTFGPVF